MQTVVHRSPHPNCHHQIVFAKTDLKLYYPPPYQREIRHYEKSNDDLIRRSIDQFPCNIRFAHIDVNQKIHLFNQTIKNILCNFIPHETVSYDDSDSPWINSKIKALIQKKNFARKCYFRNSEDIQSFRRIQNIQKLLTATIEK